jgi:hypothetical protein
MPTLIECELMERNGKPKAYTVEKVCPRIEMPKSASYFDTMYRGKLSIDIYRTPAGRYYAKPPKDENYKEVRNF